jgi:hypothetical protein
MKRPNPSVYAGFRTLSGTMQVAEWTVEEECPRQIGASFTDLLPFDYQATELPGLLRLLVPLQNVLDVLDAATCFYKREHGPSQ